MAKETAIQWCDSTVNPTMGCDGCELHNTKTQVCYAGKLHRLRGGQKGYAPTFEQVTLFPGRMEVAARFPDLRGTTRPDKPWLDHLPRLIFVSDMSDALSDEVPFSYLHQEVIDNVTSSYGQRHIWLWLTKRPRRMTEFCRWLRDRGITWPPNVWVGTSITTQATTSRITDLLEVGDAQTMYFLSVEPQWEPIQIGPELHLIDWVIQGGQSGGTTPFDLAWADLLRAECANAGVAYLLKQLGSHPISRGQPLKLERLHGDDWAEWPRRCCVREVPGQRTRRQSRR